METRLRNVLRRSPYAEQARCDTVAAVDEGDPHISVGRAAVVKATWPAIATAIGDVTPVFCKHKANAHPEPKLDLFNEGNQAQGGR